MDTLGDFDATDLLIRTQSPVPRPDPIPRPEPWGSPAPPPVRQPRPLPQPPPMIAPRPAPAQRPHPRPAEAVPAQQLIPTQQPASEVADPNIEWHRMLSRHGVPPEQRPGLVDYYYDLDRTGRGERSGIPPELDAEIRAFAKRYPGIGRSAAPAAPAAASPAPQPAAPGPSPAAPPPQAGPDTLGIDVMDLMRPAAAAPAAAPGSPVAQPQQPQQPAAPPRQPGLLSRAASGLVEAVRGRHDERYAELPSLRSPKLAPAMAMGASDDDLARQYQELFGAQYLGTIKDANGYPIIRFRGPDGKEAMAYVNKPGLDMTDVTRGMYAALPFLATGGAVGGLMRGAGLLARSAAQGGTAAATSLGQDAAAVATDTSPLDVTGSAIKAGIAGAGGVAGETIGAAGSALWRRFVTEPRYFNRSTGALTPAGEDAVRAAGLDPAALPRDVARDFSRAMARVPDDPAIALRSAASDEFKIPRTRGELTGNMEQRLREQQMQGGAYGQRASEGMTAFRRQQDAAVQAAVRGEDSIAGGLAPGRAGAGLSKSEMGANIRGALNVARGEADTQASAAWQAVPKLTATPEALAELPRVVATRASDVLIDDVVTPSAARMAQAMDRMIAGKAPAKAASVLPDGSVGDIGQMRKQMLGYYKAATTPEDKRAARALYDAFNDWIEVAAREAGDPTAAAQMLAARGISRHIHEVFEGQPGTAANRVMRSLLARDSAEGVVDALFSAPAKAQTKDGAVTALRQLRQAYDGFLPPEAARAAWDDLRLAYWLRMTSDANGRVAGPQALASGIRSAVGNQGSVVRTLYQPEEVQRMLRLASVLEDVAKRNPNTSWSAVGIGGLMRDMGNAIVSMIAPSSVLGRTAINAALAPVRGAYGAAQTSIATGGGRGAVLPTPPARSLGGVGAGIGAGQQEREP